MSGINGLGANYMTALNNSVTMTFGVTFDYYSVSGATAKTYMNSSYYTKIYNQVLDGYVNVGVPSANAEYCALNGCTLVIDDETYSLPADDTALRINKLRSNGWVDKADNEIESIYKSMGMRIGVQAKF